MFSSSWGPNAWRVFQRSVQQHGKNQSRRSNTKRFSSGSAGAASGPSPSTFDNALLKSALISGSLSLIGDMVAQTLANRSNPGTASYDAARAMRMGTFGLFFYGPYQHYWYRALDRSLPGRSVSSFLGKVALNQFCLAPVVIAAVFAWNLGLQGKLEQFTEKAKSDFIPTMITGWKFWVPAASINFTLVPLQQQVLYMSACGIVWTAILSSSSTQSQKSPVAAKKAK